MIIAYYKEAIENKTLEEDVIEIKYLDGWVEFRAEQIEERIKNVEKVVGIKESDYSVVLKPTQKGVVLNFKENDKIKVNGTDYIVVEALAVVPNKHKLKVSRNPKLFNRYADYTLFLGV